MPTTPLSSAEHFLDVIDWRQPWLAPLRACGALIGIHDWRLAINTIAGERDVRNHRGFPIVFVPQAALPSATAYEAFIGETGSVPTRENLHDFFNALIWLSFPLSKARLNALQATELSKAGTLSGSGKLRGAARDAATIFDENAAFLVVREGPVGGILVAALREHHWSEAFVSQRPTFSAADAQVWLFGHALVEKLVNPYKAITAHTFILVAPDSFFSQDINARRSWIDQRIAAHLVAHGMTIGQLTPLPVLGVPDWCANQDQAFYDDVAVFRPKRRQVL
ncbi:DUF3025 domain-containing protein [Glaciimonas sp. CA11.2]|uniref:DUF3025 domain-containing protein n=1 Tax=unclassified Glaciimonas TaxID=2644401 RepID=UPI002AB53FA9|nr:MULTISPECIES: DUF3025 domain-containing protein [unclassified Glaciimonas]MDY7546467.1 DUF3025 domain-containing protein [Glaciimonas sp. CA11.2]MEB0012858.1 DUF3025 domain-containing protein [Glaciimonas sp. Cout2]MEB0080851.1 DUF3025 domain-containing protein [Glaciimonas sp. Gout2]MEB0162231.1 DUF3025 domain-containing protein [Glaciimonas sp. CA11.2]